MPTAYTSDSFRSRKFYPFAFLVSDFAQQSARLAAVERALEQPGEQGSDTLFAGLLKRDSEFDRSSLEPREGLLPLIDLSIGARAYQVMLIMVGAGHYAGSNYGTSAAWLQATPSDL
jgi:hypothetical protein